MGSRGRGAEDGGMCLFLYSGGGGALLHTTSLAYVFVSACTGAGEGVGGGGGGSYN